MPPLAVLLLCALGHVLEEDLQKTHYPPYYNSLDKCSCALGLVGTNTHCQKQSTQRPRAQHNMQFLGFGTRQASNG